MNEVQMTTDTQESKCRSKRIASNTIVLFGRMLLLTVINLYTVRLVLKGLGEEDYGIYNTVAGVVTISACISSVLELSMQRYYAISMGKNNSLRLQEIFSSSINIIFALAVVILILFETLGLWFLNTQLIIPDTRMTTTQWIYQFSLLAFLCSILQIPYTAAIFAHEDMGIYAGVSTIDCLLKLIVALFISTRPDNGLFFYGSGLMLTAIIIMLIYIIIGRHRYSECHYRIPKSKRLYINILFFSSWALYGSVANVGIVQGSIILLNLFFGPVIIAAFAVSLQISNAFNTLSNSMVLAFRPAMIKAYAEKNYHYLNQLFTVSNKFLLYVLIAIALPLTIEMRTILGLWLGEVSDGMLLFSRLIIIYVVCIVLHHPITIIMQASGRVREYHFPVESLTLLCLPLTWLFFRMGLPSFFVYVSMIAVAIMAHLVRLQRLNCYYREFSIRVYIFNFIVPAVVIITTGSAVAVYFHSQMNPNLLRLFAVTAITFLVNTLLVYLIGTNKQEKQLLTYMFISPIINRLWIR